MPSITSGNLAAISFIKRDKKDKDNLYDLISLKSVHQKK